jgi:hypothetical protein
MKDSSRFAPALLAMVLGGLPALGAAQTTTVYTDVDYGGQAVNLAPGAYTVDALVALGIPNDSISSIKVAPGYEALLFEHGGYDGREVVKTSDTPDLGVDGFNDTISSIIIIAPSQDQHYVNSTDTLQLLNVGQLPADTVNRVVNCWRNYYGMAARFNPNAPTDIRVILDPTYGAWAEEYDQTIRISSQKLFADPWGVDMQTHEQFHVIQQYQGDVPGWIIEGMADYARYRYGLYNWQSNPPWMPINPPGPGASYTDAYQTTARFFVWLENHRRSNLSDDLTKVCQNGTYSPAFWVTEFGETIDQLWADYVANPSL